MPALPPDTYWMRGHDGQFIALVPSLNLAVVRMGLTPARERYVPQELVAEIVKSLDH